MGKREREKRSEGVRLEKERVTGKRGMWRGKRGGDREGGSERGKG